MGRTHPLPVKGMTSDGKAVAISEGEPGILTQLAGWDRFDEAANAALRPFSLSLPSGFRKPVRVRKKTVWRIAPDKALVMSAKTLGLENSSELAILDLSDARIRLILEGPGTADLLSRVMALDFSETAFPIGTFAQGSLHHVGVLVDRRNEDIFDLLIPTTWAISLTSLIADHLR